MLEYVENVRFHGGSFLEVTQEIGDTKDEDDYDQNGYDRHGFLSVSCEVGAPR